MHFKNECNYLSQHKQFSIAEHAKLSMFDIHAPIIKELQNGIESILHNSGVFFFFWHYCVPCHMFPCLCSISDSEGSILGTQVWHYCDPCLILQCLCSISECEGLILGTQGRVRYPLPLGYLVFLRIICFHVYMIVTKYSIAIQSSIAQLRCRKNAME